MTAETGGFGCRIFHGPQRVPVGAVDDESGYRPFHGIVSLGLRDSARASLAPASWPDLSGPLDRALDGDSAAAAAVPGEVLEAAADCGVLSFAGSARCARMYIEHHLAAVWQAAGAPAPLARCRAVALWNVKEGHTSSVWQVTCEGELAEPIFRFALNVARDRRAGDQLLASAAVLARMAPPGVDLQNVAQVLDARRLATAFGEVAVVAQRWIDDAMELGLSPLEGGGARLVAINRFLSSAAQPGLLTGALARALSSEETLAVARAMTTLALRGAIWELGGDRVALPWFELRRGDWVWAGTRACLVAAGAEPARHPIEELLGELVCGLVDRYGLHRDGQALVAAGAAAARAALEASSAPVGWWKLVDSASRVPTARWQALGLPTAAELDWQALAGPAFPPP